MTYLVVLGSSVVSAWLSFFRRSKDGLRKDSRSVVWWWTVWDAKDFRRSEVVTMTTNQRRYKPRMVGYVTCTKEHHIH